LLVDHERYDVGLDTPRDPDADTDTDNDRLYHHHHHHCRHGFMSLYVTSFFLYLSESSLLLHLTACVILQFFILKSLKHVSIWRVMGLSKTNMLHGYRLKQVLSGRRYHWGRAENCLSGFFLAAWDHWHGAFNRFFGLRTSGTCPWCTGEGKCEDWCCLPLYAT